MGSSLRKHVKKGSLTALAILSAMSMCMPAYAASDDEDDLKAISKVTLDVDYRILSEGVELTVESGSNQYTVEDYYIYNEPEEEWGSYDSPEVYIEISANDGYYFNKQSSSYFKINLDDGDDDEYTKTARFISADRDDDKLYMELLILLPPRNGKLGNAYNLSWSDYGVAHWDKAYGANNYKVTLHKNNSKIADVETKDNKYDFSETIFQNGTGNYKFKVKSENASKDGKTIQSYEFTVDDAALQRINVYKNSNKGSGGPGGPGDTTPNPENNMNPIDPNGYKPSNDQMNNYMGGPGTSGLAKGWIKDGNNGKWWYRNDDLSWTKNNWQNINNAWYFFDEAGWMKTGWQFINNKWYFLDTVNGWMHSGWILDNNKWYHTDASGAMQTGWIYVDNVWYYMGTDGAMLTGYQFINGNWYYLNERTDLQNKKFGGMYINETVPDGRYADGTGRIA